MIPMTEKPKAAPHQSNVAAPHDSKPVPVMNEFLNFVTYDWHTAERNGPRRAAKGITSHVF